MTAQPTLPTRTGFTRPLAAVQIGSWLVYVLELGLYFAVIFPTLTIGERIGITIPWLILFTIFNLFFLFAECESHPTPFVVKPSATPGCYMCDNCNKFVMPGSKHCFYCGICRLDFDHHCFFLNNCVTRANYRHFLRGVIVLTIFSLFTMFISIWAVMGNVYEGGLPVDRASEFYSVKVPWVVLYIGCGAFMFVQLGILVFMGYLLALHWALRKRHITTYQLIVYWRQAKLEAEARNFQSQNLLDG
jgi:hypothetical protein